MFRVHSVSQRPNLRHLGEPLGVAESLLEAVSLKKATEGMGIEEKSLMPDGSEFHTVNNAVRLAHRANSTQTPQASSVATSHFQHRSLCEGISAGVGPEYLQDFCVPVEKRLSSFATAGCVDWTYM